MREIYNNNLSKFSAYLNNQGKSQELSEDDFFSHPPICHECGEELDRCECDTQSDEDWLK